MIDILTSATISTAAVAVIAYLAREWISTRLRNAIKLEYEQKLETHKTQLRSESDATLERLRADLSIAAAEHEIRFAKLHEKRGEVIAETYALLTDLHRKIGNYVKIFEPAGDAPKEQRRQEVEDAHRAFIEYYPKKRIFLPEAAVEKIDSINEQSVSAFYDFFYGVEMQHPHEGTSTEKWMEIFKKVRDEMPVALKELERDFRGLLGDKGEQGHSADASTSRG